MKMAIVRKLSQAKDKYTYKPSDKPSLELVSVDRQTLENRGKVDTLLIKHRGFWKQMIPEATAPRSSNRAHRQVQGGLADILKTTGLQDLVSKARMNNTPLHK